MVLSIHHFRFGWGLLAAIIPLSGCGPRRPEWMIPPPLDSKAVTQAVMKAADANGNGTLEEREFATIPALRGAVKELDTSGDKRLSSSEIEAWLMRLKTEDLAFHEAALTVTQSGRPVANVLVKIVPEPCMGAGIESAQGLTDATGLTFLTMPNGRTWGVRGGLYRLEITGQGADGNPIPEKYNTASKLGLAVGAGLPDPRTPNFALD